MMPHLQKLLALLAGIALGALALRRRRSPHQPESMQARPALRSKTAVVGMDEPQPKRRGWKQWIWPLAALLAVFALGGVMVVASGIIPIKASSGHWAVTRWLLEFAKSRSLATHTIGLSVPELDHEQFVLKGAGHYETGCAPCHGSPQRARPPVLDHMLPAPPQLKQISSKRDPEELFHIVKHGIKFTGMPAWPSMHRDDEVWAMVAFLLRLPHLDGLEYQNLVYGDTRSAATPAETIAVTATQSCARCHGADGNGRGTGAFPKLAGQRSQYLFASMQAYAKGERHSGVMEPIASALTPETMRHLADYYSELRPGLSLEEPAPSFERGRSIAHHGIPHQQVPACAACHLPSGEMRNPHYPNLTGQYAAYIQLQLGLFQSRHRGGTAYADIMHQVAEHLTKEQMRDVAAYFAGMGASEEGRQ